MSKDNTARYRLVAAYYTGEAQFNATRAIELAGYTAKDRKTLTSMASQIMKHPVVQQMIKEHVEQVEMTQGEILGELARLARWDHESEENQPDMVSPNANAEAKKYDTMMRAKLTSLNNLLKINTAGIKDQVEKLAKAFEQHRIDHPEVSDEERAEQFKQHVPPNLVEEMLRNLMTKAENRRRMTETEAVIEEPMLEEVQA